MLKLVLEIFKFFLNYIWIVNLFFILIIVFMEKKNPLYTILWIFVLTIFPYFGFFIYLFLGMSFTKERVINKIYKKNKSALKRDIGNSEKENIKNLKSLITYLNTTSGNSLNNNNLINIYHQGSDFFKDLKKAILNAKTSICMEYYIFKLDNIGKEISELLLKKSKEGVKVTLIIDGMNKANRKLENFFKDSNVEINFFFRTYIPVFNLRINYRNHKKISVIDSEVAFIGGMNIGDEYLNHSKLGYWRDTSVRILGDAVLTLEKEFFFTLGIIKKVAIKYEEVKYNFLKVFRKYVKMQGEHFLLQKDFSNAIQVVSSGPNYEFRTLRDNFLKLIQEAKSSIIIQTPYFVPDDSLFDALKTSILSGVDVKIMIPNKSDHLFIYWVNQFYVAQLLKIGASIYRYDRGFLHSKVLIIDSEVATIGTCNFDYRSFYLNFEININIYEKDIASSLKNQFYRDINDSKKLELKDFEQRSIYIRLKESILRLLSPIL